MDASMASSRRPGYELRFACLQDSRRGYTFPCDAAGRVDMDALTERARNTSLYARAVVGKEFSRPTVQVNGAR